jgi:hypothetical protein
MKTLDETILGMTKLVLSGKTDDIQKLSDQPLII